MAKEFLTSDEREDLKAKYKAKMLKEAPHNITDATLITNFGNDEQKKRLPADTNAPAAIAKKTTTENSGEQKGNEPSKDKSAETKGAGAEGTKSATEKPPVTENVKGAEGEKGAEGLGLPSGSSAQDKGYIEALNQYINLNGGNAPAKEMTEAELRAEISEILAKQEADKQTKETQAKATEVAPAKGEDEVVLVHKKNGTRKIVNATTYEKFLKNDKNYELAPEVPKEVKALKNG